MNPVMRCVSTIRSNNLATCIATLHFPRRAADWLRGCQDLRDSLRGHQFLTLPHVEVFIGTDDFGSPALLLMMKNVTKASSRNKFHLGRLPLDTTKRAISEFVGGRYLVMSEIHVSMFPGKHYFAHLYTLIHVHMLRYMCTFSKLRSFFALWPFHLRVLRGWWEIIETCWALIPTERTTDERLMQRITDMPAVGNNDEKYLQLCQRALKEGKDFRFVSTLSNPEPEELYGFIDKVCGLEYFDHITDLQSEQLVVQPAGRCQ